MHSTKQVLFFVFAMTTVVALVLSSFAYGWEGRVKKNEDVYNKKATLSAIQSKLPKSLDDMEEDEILNIFKDQITQIVVDSKGNEMKPEAVEALGYGGSTAEKLDMKKEKKKPLADRAWPFYKYSADDGKDYYILTVRGSGLWDEIWGYIALESDLNTIAGVSFDHKGETPGLGAEIKDNKDFQKNFIGTTLKNADGIYTGILVRKGGAKNNKYEVDGITGATITADGVTAMIAEGVIGYAPYLSSL